MKKYRVLDYSPGGPKQAEVIGFGGQILPFFTPAEPVKQLTLPEAAIRERAPSAPPFVLAGQEEPPSFSENTEKCTEETENVQAKRAELEKAVNYYRSAGKTSWLELAGSLQQLGSLYQNEGNRDEALRHYEESLSLLQQMPSSETASSKAHALKQLGSLHYELQRFPEALQHFEAALDLTEKHFTPQSGPSKLEASSIAILSAALRMATGEQARINGRSTPQFIALAERYLEGLDQENHLVRKRMEELKYSKRVLEGLLEGSMV